MTEPINCERGVCEENEEVLQISESIVDKDSAAGVCSIVDSSVDEYDSNKNQEEVLVERSKKRKKNKKQKKRKDVVITDEDFGPIVDFTKKEGFVYDPYKAEFDINEVHLERRPWEIPDVRSVAYLRRLERKHNRIVHGLASVRNLTPKQVFKEEIREITKYNEDIREEIQQEHIRNGDWEYVDNEVHFVADDIKEMDIPLLNGEFSNEVKDDSKEEFVVCSSTIYCIIFRMSDGCDTHDIQEPPPGTDLHEGAYCWKCKGNGYLEVKRKRTLCSVCHGNRVILSEKRRNVFNKPGRIMPDRRWPEGMIIPGPDISSDVSSPNLKPSNGEAVCSLVGKWKIFQKQGGHRFSTDDVTTAWVAINRILEMQRAGTNVTHHLDMGCGLGSVLMMVGWKFPQLVSTGIEAQSISCGLARRSIRYNGASDRMTVYNGDLRDVSILPTQQKFEIVTGTPPYFKSGEGALSAKVDQKACLFEFRGGVEDYIEAAGRYLTDNGHFVVVESALGKKRFDSAAVVHKMKVVERWDFIPKEGKPPLFSIADMVKGESNGDEYPVKMITIRNKNGLYTKEYHQLLLDMGFPPQKDVEEFCVCLLHE